MNKRVLEVSRASAVLLNAESRVKLVVEVDGKRVPVRHEHPLTHIELAVCYNQRIFDVLLNYPLRAVAVNSVKS